MCLKMLNVYAEDVQTFLLHTLSMCFKFLSARSLLISKRLNFKSMLTGSASAKFNFDHDENKKNSSFLFESQSCLSKEALKGQ
jgi:hypothetical protein